MPLKLHDNALVAFDTDGDNAVSLSEWLSGDRSGATAVRLEPADDALALADSIDQLERVEVSYPAFTDGRAHSQAHLLRQRLNYSGEIRAIGDVRPDQVAMMVRCGITSFTFDDPAAEQATAAPAWQVNLERYTGDYQTGYR